ncbi:hypothetical protein [Litoribacillus peritrichatus]|uniref:Uncharacterized protein n=1 Tax=Litoribacillus peritrichatus TaxID=718191 RepID=A0ABP7M0J5_9GAMM
MKYLYAENYRQVSEFSYVTWPWLVEVIREPRKIEGLTTEEAKNSSPLIAAHDAVFKTKQAALKHNNFTLLRLDLDDYPYGKHVLERQLKELGIESYIIHSTANHTPNVNNRYRLYIELVESLSYEHWQMVQTYLAYYFGADDCSSRPQQMMFLPFWSTGYEFSIGVGRALDLKELHSKLWFWAVEFNCDQEDSIKAAEGLNIDVVTQPKTKLVGRQVSIIDLVNQSYDWDELLSSYGYRRQGKAYLPPESQSMKAGVYILRGSDGKDRYYSHHESDPCCIGRCLDKFDLIVVRSYSGDALMALKSLAENHFPDINKFNKKEWYRTQKNLQAKQVWSGGYE